MRRRERVGDETSLRVFISYRRSETGPYARNIYDALTHRFGEGSVFLDIDSIAPGRDFVDVLSETLDEADILLVVMGPRWAEIADDTGKRRIDDPNDYVRLEVETALRSDDVRVIPVLVGAGVMPPPSALPESLAALTRRNATSLVDEHWRSTMDELVVVLEHIRDEVATTKVGRSAPQPGAVSGPQHHVAREDAPHAQDPDRPAVVAPAGPGAPAAAPAHAPTVEDTRSGRRRNRTIVAGVAALVVVLVGVAAVVVSSGGTDAGSRGAVSASTRAPRTSVPPVTAAKSYRVGDCLTANTTGSAPAVSCDDPHTHEITNVTPYPAAASAPWPSPEQFLAIGEPLCTEAFTTYVGVSPDTSQYDSALIAPSQEEWADGKRDIFCAATSPDSAVTTGSVRDSGR